MVQQTIKMFYADRIAKMTRSLPLQFMDPKLARPLIQRLVEAVIIHAIPEIFLCVEGANIPMPLLSLPTLAISDIGDPTRTSLTLAHKTVKGFCHHHHGDHQERSVMTIALSIDFRYP
ncbi:hypothetical protein R1flu_006920 [Riccia fluitans]|uniref:Uncharacterized protein n=1 Tax=Riccia fluitans TaxID=41844 RepID=A0ABD1YXE4_9MARC